MRKMLQHHNHPNRSPTLILLAAVVALIVGFLAPRPTFVNDLLGQGDFMGTEVLADESSLKSSSNSDATVAGTATHPLVKVDFYGESLCPDCQHMVRDVLAPLFDNGVSKLMELRYIAYGNVRGDLTKGEQISCQHGAEECKYNRYINCAQNSLEHDQEKWFPYVLCMAEHMSDLTNSANACAEKVGLKSSDILECAAGSEGNAFELEAAKETGALEPKHTFVPWVVVNGIPLGGAFEDLQAYVCAASPPGVGRPPACTDLLQGMKFMRG
jgi:interferon gamma-inducible protein 30